VDILLNGRDRAEGFLLVLESSNLQRKF
jgi:hypothetical protein